MWILIKYCWYSQFWHLTRESFGWVLYWLLIKVSFRYKIAHVWEENESLVISNCALEVPIRSFWKISVKTKHPVPWYMKTFVIHCSMEMIFNTIVAIIKLYFHFSALFWSLVEITLTLELGWKFSGGIELIFRLSIILN